MFASITCLSLFIYVAYMQLIILAVSATMAFTIWSLSEIPLVLGVSATALVLAPLVRRPPSTRRLLQAALARRPSHRRRR